jgi:hypothetical protein
MATEFRAVVPVLSTGEAKFAWHALSRPDKFRTTSDLGIRENEHPGAMPASEPDVLLREDDEIASMRAMLTLALTYGP